MIGTLATIGLAFVLGAQHAIEPDHIVAVSTLVGKKKKTSACVKQGILWGLGHTTTLFIGGLLVLLLKISIPERIALSLEFIVGLMIAGLGIHMILKLISGKKHVHRHSHHGHTHTHFHSHTHSKEHEHNHASYLVGIMHGMAGSASLMLLVLSTLQSTLLGLLFIIMFGLGSVLGMALVSYVMSLPFTYSAKKSNLLNKRVQYFTGVFSICFGVFLAVSIVLREGLLL